MKGKIFDRIITIILTLVCIGLAVAVYMRSSGSADEGKMMPPGMGPQTENSASAAANVNVITAEASEFIKTRKLSGEISSLDKDISVLSDVSGKVSRIIVKRGDIVKKGDVLLYVDPSKPGMSYKESAVLSPSDGIIYEINAAESSTINTNTSLITLRGERSLKIDISIPEKDVGTVSIGAKAAVSSVAYPGRTWDAEVTYIADSLDPSSRTRSAELSINGDSEGLLEGMYVTSEVEVKKIEDAITVPSAAISSYAGNSIVYLVIDGKAVRTIISTGDSNSEMTVITSGVNAGDLVITAGNITDGTAVAIV